MSAKPVVLQPIQTALESSLQDAKPGTAFAVPQQQQNEHLATETPPARNQFSSNTDLHSFSRLAAPASFGPEQTTYKFATGDENGKSRREWGRAQSCFQRFKTLGKVVLILVLAIAIVPPVWRGVWTRERQPDGIHYYSDRAIAHGEPKKTARALELFMAKDLSMVCAAAWDVGLPVAHLTIRNEDGTFLHLVNPTLISETHDQHGILQISQRIFIEEEASHCHVHLKEENVPVKKAKPKPHRPSSNQKLGMVVSLINQGRSALQAGTAWAVKVATRAGEVGEDWDGRTTHHHIRKVERSTFVQTSHLTPNIADGRLFSLLREESAFCAQAFHDVIHGNWPCTAVSATEHEL